MCITLYLPCKFNQLLLLSLQHSSLLLLIMPHGFPQQTLLVSSNSHIEALSGNKENQNHSHSLRTVTFL